MSERRNSIQEVVKSASNGDWSFLSRKQFSSNEKLEFFRQSPELRKLALKELGRSGVSFQKKLTKDIMSLLLQDFIFPEDEAGATFSYESSEYDDEAVSDSDPLIPDDVSEGYEGVYEGEGDVYEDVDVEEDIEDDDDTSNDSTFKRVVMTAQRFGKKQVASVCGLIWSIILIFTSPYGIFCFLLGIVPLLCGIFGNQEIRNSFKPFKWVWFAISFYISPSNLFFFIFGLIIGILILVDDKNGEIPTIPESKEDGIIARYYSLSRLGIPLPWRRFTIERSGGKLRFTNTTKLYGGNNAQQFMYAKDPELLSSFASVFWGGYQYITLKDTKTEKEVLRVRLPKTSVQALVASGFLSKICELAKSSEELGGGSRVLHS